MADNYLNSEGLAKVAQHVNEKLKVVTTMPLSPKENDIVLYNGNTTTNLKQGSIYLYKVIKTYYEWDNLSDTYYTESETPKVGDTVYSDTLGTDSGFTIEAYDSVNEEVTINSLTYNRHSAGDTPIYNWVIKESSNGYSPSFLGNSIVFAGELIPEIQGNTIVFNLDE